MIADSDIHRVEISSEEGYAFENTGRGVCTRCVQVFPAMDLRKPKTPSEVKGPGLFLSRFGHCPSCMDPNIEYH
jgi:hypothetical protein